MPSVQLGLVQSMQQLFASVSWPVQSLIEYTTLWYSCEFDSSSSLQLVGVQWVKSINIDRTLEKGGSTPHLHLPDVPFACSTRGLGSVMCQTLLFVLQAIWGERLFNDSVDIYESGRELRIVSTSIVTVTNSSCVSVALPMVVLRHRLVDFTILSKISPVQGAFSTLNSHSSLTPTKYCRTSGWSRRSG